MSAEPEIIAAVEDKECQELRDWAAVLREFVKYTNPYSSDEYYYEKGKFSPNNHGDMEVDYAVCLTKDWRPDDLTTGQIWLVIERMREKGYTLRLDMWGKWGGHPGRCTAEFKFGGFQGKGTGLAEHQFNPALAILKAARATEKQNGRD